MTTIIELGEGEYETLRGLLIQLREELRTALPHPEARRRAEETLRRLFLVMGEVRFRPATPVESRRWRAPLRSPILEDREPE